MVTGYIEVDISAILHFTRYATYDTVCDSTVQMKTENVFGLPAAAATKKCELSNGSLTTPELCAFLCSSSCTLFVSSCYSKLRKFALKPVAFITLHILILIFSSPCSKFPYSSAQKPCVLELVCFCIEHILLLVDPFAGVEIYFFCCTAPRC